QNLCNGCEMFVEFMAHELAVYFSHGRCRKILVWSFDAEQRLEIRERFAIQQIGARIHEHEQRPADNSGQDRRGGLIDSNGVLKSDQNVARNEGYDDDDIHAAKMLPLS